MIAVGTTQNELASASERLRDAGCDSLEVVAPGPTRRVILARLSDEQMADEVAGLLREKGIMAVARPAEGPQLTAWLRRARPITFGGRLTVCPVWSEHERCKLPGLIELGPGGFGTGRHPSTRLVIDELLRSIAGGERVLDVGCGSGILALCALRLGAARAVGIDIRQTAVDAAAHNAEINDVQRRIDVSHGSVTEAYGEFDVVVANIARAAIVSLAPVLVAAVAAGGRIVLSGITPSQCSQIAGFLRPLVEVGRRAEGDWAVLALARH